LKVKPSTRVQNIQSMIGVALSADGIPLSYEVMGAGAPALVFVHGWSCDRSYWRHQLGHFSRRHEVVALDLAGHGASGAGRATYTMAGFGGDVVAVVEQLGLRQVVLVGHSMGGDVIAEAAPLLGGRVLGLVWADVYNTLDEPLADEEIEQFAAPFRQDFIATTREFVRGMFTPGSDPDLVAWVVADMSSAPPEVAVDALEHKVSNDRAIGAALRKVSAPVVAINAGSQPTDIESLRRHGVETVLMPGVGHFEMLEDPDTFNQVLSRTIEQFVA
jgi:pimeloyl-ACP methyl ester carboxylesterase